MSLPNPIARKPQSALPVIRDLLVFQFKLLLDSLRDVLLSPISILATLYGVLTRPDDPGRYLLKIKRYGRRSDAWINLFGQYQRHPFSKRNSTDAYVYKLERMLLREYDKGGLVRSVKDGTDGLIERLQREHQKDRSRKPKKSAGDQ